MTLPMFDENNPFVKKFSMARDRLNDHDNEEFIIRMIGAKEGDHVQYNLPTTDELAMLVVGDLPSNVTSLLRHIVIVGDFSFI
jgi:hypothetical protein